MVDKKRGFLKPSCSECGTELAPQRTAYDGQRRLFCDRCKPIANVKQQWQPLGVGSTVSRMFILDPKPNSNKK